MEDRTGLDMDQAPSSVPWLGTSKKIFLNKSQVFKKAWKDVFYESLLAAIEPTIHPDAIEVALKAYSSRYMGQHKLVSLEIFAFDSDILHEKEWHVHVTSEVTCPEESEDEDGLEDEEDEEKEEDDD